MKVNCLKAVLDSLNKAGVKYLIAGGVAVNIHGYQRLTRDLDLVIQLGKENLHQALKALKRLGYRPTIPVSAEEFLDENTRRQWVEEKNMRVFSLISDDHRETTVDIFATEPFDFDKEYRECLEIDLDDDLSVCVVSIPALIRMKEGRDETGTGMISGIWPGYWRRMRRAGEKIMKKSGNGNKRDWGNVTWEGARRAQLRRSLELTPRQRFEALEEMAETAEWLSKAGGKHGDEIAGVTGTTGVNEPVSGYQSGAADEEENTS